MKSAHSFSETCGPAVSVSAGSPMRIAVGIQVVVDIATIPAFNSLPMRRRPTALG